MIAPKENKIVRPPEEKCVSHAESHALSAFLRNWATQVRPAKFRRQHGVLGEFEFVWSGVEWIPSPTVEAEASVSSVGGWWTQDADIGCLIDQKFVLELSAVYASKPFDSGGTTFSRIELGIIETQLVEIMRLLGVNSRLTHLISINAKKSSYYKISGSINRGAVSGAFVLYLSEGALLQLIEAPALGDVWGTYKVPVNLEVSRTQVPMLDMRRLSVGDAIVFDDIAAPEREANHGVLLSFSDFVVPAVFSKVGKISLSGTMGTMSPQVTANMSRMCDGTMQVDTMNDHTIDVSAFIEGVRLSPADLIGLLKGNELDCSNQGPFRYMLRSAAGHSCLAELKSVNGCLAAIVAGQM